MTIIVYIFYISYSLPYSTCDITINSKLSTKVANILKKMERIINLNG
jgi:hypothetical protein